jgi:hypothetical protein
MHEEQIVSEAGVVHSLDSAHPVIDAGQIQIAQSRLNRRARRNAKPERRGFARLLEHRLEDRRSDQVEERTRAQDFLQSRPQGRRIIHANGFAIGGDIRANTEKTALSRLPSCGAMAAQKALRRLQRRLRGTSAAVGVAAVGKMRLHSQNQAARQHRKNHVVEGFCLVEATPLPPHLCFEGPERRKAIAAAVHLAREGLGQLGEVSPQEISPGPLDGELLFGKSLEGREVSLKTVHGENTGKRMFEVDA